MKTLDEIENDVLDKHEWTDWRHLLYEHHNTEDKLVVIREIARRYAEQAIERCAESAMVISPVGYVDDENIIVDKNAILNVKTELK